MEESGWRSLCREIRRKTRARGRTRIDRSLSEELTDKLDQLKRMFVRDVVGDELETAHSWADKLREITVAVKKALRLDEVIFPRELGSFLEDLEAHLRKKLFIYAMDLARGRLSLGSFEDKSRRAIQTSLQTNLRSIYQSWVFLTILKQITEEDGNLVYPEHGYLSLERSGRQRLSSIPPNTIMDSRNGFLSFFLEAPRPIAWEDTEDLKRVWRLYKAMRPDILVYGGRIMNILAEDLDPPIRRPDLIIECKELEDWYKRTRELKVGERPLSAEEWRWMWLQGLWRGLGKELGARVRPEGVEADLGERIRLKEPEIVKLYMKIYEPKELILITRCKTPDELKADLKSTGIEIIDDTGFDEEKLRDASEKLLEYAKPVEDLLVIRGELARAVRRKSRALGKTPEELIKEAVENL